MVVMKSLSIFIILRTLIYQITLLIIILTKGIIFIILKIILSMHIFNTIKPLSGSSFIFVVVTMQGIFGMLECHHRERLSDAVYFRISIKISNVSDLTRTMMSKEDTGYLFIIDFIVDYYARVFILNIYSDNTTS